MTTLPPPTHPKYPLQDEESAAIAELLTGYSSRWQSLTSVRDYFTTERDRNHGGWESRYEADLSAWREYQRRGDS